MAKAQSPVRLAAELMDAATQHGKLNHRSAAEPVEYWAELGQKLSSIIDPETLLKVQAGALTIELQETASAPIDPESVFAGISAKRRAGTLGNFINRDKPVYRASEATPGKLEQISPDGKVAIGQFKNGKFQADKQRAS